MKQSNDVEGILKLFEKGFQLTGQDFFKASALFAPSLMVGSAGSFTFRGCNKKSGWKMTSFSRLLLYNFQR